MSEKGANLMWRLQLAFWLIYFGFERIPHFIKAFRWASQEEWQNMYIDGYGPKDAIIEDMSNAY